MSAASIVCSNLSFSWPDGTPVFQELSMAVGAGRTGLIAPNGAGKSTLLKLIAGLLRPAQGTVTVTGELGYLPQDLPLRAEATVADALEIAEVVAAIDAVESGDVAEEHFTVIGEDWDVEERALAQLDRLGLGGFGLDRQLETLSGGQIVSLGLAGRLLRRPDVLLLDEPTNNLDAAARERLAAVLEEFTGCLLLVSHDRALLDTMDRIAELEHGVVRLHGGAFTDYEEAVRAEQETAERQVRSAEQELKREKRELQQARERADRRASNASRNLANAGLPRILAGARQRAAQNSAGRAGQMHAGRVDGARARLDQASRALRDDTRITVELPGTRVPAGRTLLTAEGIRLRRGETELFDGGGSSGNGGSSGSDSNRPGLDLIVRGPERIALTGANGVGKSSLLRLITGEIEPDEGRVQRGEGRIAFLSQRLDLLDPERSVAENLAEFAPTTPPAERMNLLARFLFRGARAHLPVAALSGGELLRATLACVLCAEPAPQLLLLDEPTNNLDLVSVAQLADALTAYEGAFIVVSHDERFLDDIAVDRRLELRDGGLIES
jgi:ATPase subunit of ABC transporter with duplicated ATPase domains